MVFSCQPNIKQIYQTKNFHSFSSSNSKLLETLFDAAERSDGSIVDLIKLSQLGFNFHLVDEMNRNALFVAGSAEVVDFLVGQGLDPNHEDINGRTPLFTPSFTDVSEALIEHGAKVNHVDLNGETPLFFAIDEEDIKMLIGSGANIHHKNFNDETPLFTHFFDQGGIESLVKCGIDIEHENKDGQTALMVCAINYRWDEVADLVQAGANLNHKNPQGKTALDLVLDKNRASIEKEGFWSSLDNDDFVLQRILKSLGYQI